VSDVMLIHQNDQKKEKLKNKAYALSIKSAEIFTDNNVGNVMLTITLLYASYNVKEKNIK
jgi:hypothetical protein